MIHSNKFNDNVRIPIIPLPEELKHLRQNGEIIVDEKNKKIFITDRENIEIMHDLTDWIVSHMDKINGDLIQITIEGIGTVLIKNIIKDIINMINERTIEAIDISDFAFYYPEGDIDLKSLKPNLNKLEVSGFANALNNSIPVKINNNIEWIELSKISGNVSGDNSENNANNTDNTNNSIDLAYGNVFDIVPQNNILYLIISLRQQSRYLSGNYLVVLPKSIYSYISLEWNIITNDNTLTLSFQNNIFFNTSDFNRFKANTHYSLKFISHDKGKTWICEIKEFYSKYLGGE